MQTIRLNDGIWAVCLEDQAPITKRNAILLYPRELVGIVADGRCLTGSHYMPSSCWAAIMDVYTPPDYVYKSSPYGAILGSVSPDLTGFENFDLRPRMWQDISKFQETLSVRRNSRSSTLHEGVDEFLSFWVTLDKGQLAEEARKEQEAAPVLVSAATPSFASDKLKQAAEAMRRKRSDFTPYPRLAKAERSRLSVQAVMADVRERYDATVEMLRHCLDQQKELLLAGNLDALTERLGVAEVWNGEKETYVTLARFFNYANDEVENPTDIGEVLDRLKYYQSLLKALAELPQ